jgi:hypothetical protein
LRKRKSYNLRQDPSEKHQSDYGVNGVDRGQVAPQMQQHVCLAMEH